MTRDPRKAGYQPVWEGGREHGVGWRDASGRYEAIKRYLVARMGTDARQLPPEPSVFELGAYNGYFCRRLADDFGSRCTAVDGQPFLQDYQSPTGGGSVTAARRLMDPQAITATGEHDIVMAMSVLHHWPNWREYAEALINVGRVVFIETANPHEKLSGEARGIAAAAHDYFAKDLGAKVVAETLPMASHGTVTRPMWVVDNG